MTLYWNKDEYRIPEFKLLIMTLYWNKDEYRIPELKKIIIKDYQNTETVIAKNSNNKMGWGGETKF
jgi:hypothetical protein